MNTPETRTCENCRVKCGGFLGRSPSECGSWEPEYTQAESAARNGREPTNFVPMGDITESGRNLWAPSFGLTKREHFAALAMQGIMANEGEEQCYPPDIAARRAVALADALLYALAQTTTDAANKDSDHETI